MSNDNIDPMVKFKSVRRSQNKKGGDMLTLSLSAEEVEILLAAAQAQQTERGVQLQVHFTERTNQKTGEVFDSAIAFVKGIQDPKPPGQRYGDGARTSGRQGGYIGGQGQNAAARSEGPSAQERLAALKRGR